MPDSMPSLTLLTIALVHISPMVLWNQLRYLKPGAR